MRKSWVLLALFLLSAGLFFASRQTEKETEAALRPSAPAPAEVEEERPPAALSEPALSPEATAEAPRRQAVEAPVAATPPPAAPSEAPPAGRVLRGTVKILEIDGSETLDANGTFDVVLWQERFGSHETVQFENGQFEVTLDSDPDVKQFEVAKLTRDERPLAIVSPLERFDLTDTIEVVGRMPRSSILEVTDANTGIDLTDVEFVEAESFPRDRVSHPGLEYQNRKVASGLSSPITMDSYADEIDRDFLVGAKGYSWARTKMDFLQGGTMRVVLAVAGTITVDLSGVEKGSGARLRFFRKGQYGPVAEVRARKNGPLEFSRLEPGDYKIQVQIGEFYDSPVVLGTAELTLSAGEHTRVALDLTPPPIAEFAPMAGWVHVAKDWGAEQVQLVLDLLDTPLENFEDHHFKQLKEPTQERAGHDSFRFEWKKLQVGKYELGLSNPVYSIAIKLPPGGRDDFELVIPPPTELLVYLTEKGTGTLITSDELYWNPKRPEGVSGGTLEKASFSEEKGAHLIRSAECEIQLMLWPGDYTNYSETLDLAQGIREHRVELTRSCGFTLTMHHDDTPILFPDNWTPSVEAEGESGRHTSTSFGAHQYAFRVTEPGMYTITMPDLPAYRPIPKQRIEILPETITEHVVQLELK